MKAPSPCKTCSEITPPPGEEGEAFQNCKMSLGTLTLAEKIKNATCPHRWTQPTRLFVYWLVSFLTSIPVLAYCWATRYGTEQLSSGVWWAWTVLVCYVLAIMISRFLEGLTNDD